MCIAIFKPRKTQPDWSAYQSSYDNNPDGWGFAAARNGKLIVRKGVSSFRTFKKKFYEFRHCPALVHFRIRTSGDINDKNCHPFLIDQDLAVIHNGILDLKCNINKNMSDTWHFVRQVLRPLNESDQSFPWNLGLSFLGEQFLGTGNKMVFLRSTGEHTIWNGDSGHYASDKHWYSNYSYTYGNRHTGKPKTHTVTFSQNYDRISWPDIRSGYGYYTPQDSASRKKDADADQKQLLLTTADKVEQPKKEKEEVETIHAPLDIDDRLSLPSDDPLGEALGYCTASDYDAAQGLVAAGLPTYAISELYKWWPESLENLWYTYCTDFENIEPGYSVKEDDS